MDFLYFIYAFFIILYFWNKHNKNHLTVEEKKLASSLFSEACQGEMKYIWAILAAILIIFGFLFLLEKVFAVKNASDLFYVFAWLSMTRGIFRNRAIYRKANLPQKFVRGDFALGIFIISAFAVTIVFIFGD